MQRIGPTIGFAPWIVTLMVAAIGGSTCYVLWQRWDSAKLALDQSAGELMVIRQQASEKEESERKLRAAYNLLGDRCDKEQDALKKEIEEKARAEEELNAKLRDIISSDDAELIDKGGGKLGVKLMDRVLFRSGEAELTDKGKEVLRAVGDALNQLPDKQVWVQGHTDNVPISRAKKSLFASNWELSATRALNVVHFLQDEVGVDPERLAAMAFSQYQPLSKKKKAKNRRIEIVLVPREVLIVEE